MTLPGLFLAQESQRINGKIYSAWRVERQDFQHLSLNFINNNVYTLSKSLFP